MIATFEIHALKPEDLPAYKALRDLMLTAHEDAFTSDALGESSRSAASYRFRLPQANGNGTLFTLCAWVGAEMVGAITCERDDRAKVAHIGHIVGMMVRDDMQGQGLGNALLKTALNLARGDGRLEQLILTVTASNHGAVRLYARAGFVRYGTLPRAIKLPVPAGESGHPVYLDKDLMVCPLR
ncbi:MAG: GNAT family N-acetyltransferase [Burkholderiaceae bacterium]|nr:GNAT family N-acetyltransferase [Burkholderiaceae bacterium]